MPNTTYSVSFTIGALLYRESTVVAEQYQAFDDWSVVRTCVLEQNLLQSNTMGTAKRICTEVTSRLKFLNPDQLDLLVEGTMQEQRYLLWLAICQRYRLIHDFTTEVIHQKFLQLSLSLTHQDYEIFFNQKQEWHPELEKVSEARRKKSRQTIFQMLKEAGLLTRDQAINPALLSSRLSALIGQDSEGDWRVFPVQSLEIR